MSEKSSVFARGSGVLLHITSLPSRHGIGDLGPEAYRFADMLHAAKQCYWQVLPLNPTQEGGANSPYFSASASAGNPLLISLEFLEKEGLCGNIAMPGSTSDEAAVDFGAVTTFKYEHLEAAYDAFVKNGDTVAFKNFCKDQEHWLDDYALFIALKRAFDGGVWSAWPEPLRLRKKKALKEAAVEHSGAIEHEKWYQFVFFTQWNKLKCYCNERGISMIGDVPIYVCYDSVDVWAHPELYKLDSSYAPTGVSGVPPDYFSATGQLWNNPVYNWNIHQSTGFSWWVERMALMLDRFDFVRVDHFRGLVEYWEVPAGETTAMNGSWQPVPTYAFFDTLKKKLGKFPVIAEDLGIITDDVKEAMSHYQLPGMKVLLFAFGESDPFHPYLPHMYPRNCIVYTGTHDNNTIRGWYEAEADQATRKRLLAYAGSGDESSASVVWGMIRLAQSSVADCAIIAAQDLLVLDASCRMNTPSTASGNWQWRMTAEQMRRMPIEHLAEMAKLYGRVPDTRG